MKYAVAMVWDQTWAYVGENGEPTTDYAKARLWDSSDEVERAAAELPTLWVEVVEDETEWRKSHNTWCTDEACKHPDCEDDEDL